MIYKDEQLIQIAEFDDAGEIRFTKELLEATKDLPGVRKFVSQLVSHWGPEYATMLDYFGPEDSETDKYTGLDTDPFDCREDICDLWDYKDLATFQLNSEFYRDIMRAKLVSIKLPERLIKEYIKAANKFYTQ
jgi:hypothetical protein